MADLTNEELKAILEKRLEYLQNNPQKTEPKSINAENLQFLLKTLALPSDFAPLAQSVLELAPRPKVIWLHFAECTGCSESLFRTAAPDLVELMFDYLSFEYQETIMAANGWQAEECIDKVLESGEDFILAVEGAVSPIDLHFFSVGPHGQNSYESLAKVSAKAKAIFAIGTCSSYGGIQAANPNPTQTCGIQEMLTQKVVLVPGCPPSDINIVATLCFYALFETTPNLDERNRPKWAYGKCLHDMCERKAKFEAGIFAQKFDDDLAKSGACLFKVGCKGPYTYNNCPKVKFNAKTSWPVQAGHGCMACSEANFWDEFGLIEEPMKNIFAYKDHAFKDFESNDTSTSLTQKLSEKNIILSFDEELGIFYQKDGQNCNFLNFEFESNVRLILANLAKNKMGASLLEVYKKEFAQNYAFIEQNYDENPKPSKDLKAYFEYIYVLARGEKLPNLQHFLDLASAYKIKHAGAFDIKLSLNENEAKLDITKSFRFPLIYLCGGLDLEAIAFSACEAIFQNLDEALKFLSQRQNKTANFHCAESLNAKFIYHKLSVV